MAQTIDVSKFFDQKAFSDVTVKFGDHLLRCHKIILCTNSEYFNNLCGPGKQFAESSQPVIELKDDDEEAVRAMLRWIYSFDYETEETKKLDDQFNFHVHVHVTADKYGLQALKEEAFKRVVVHVEGVDNPTFADVIRTGHYNIGAELPEVVGKVVQQVRDERIWGTRCLTKWMATG